MKRINTIALIALADNRFDEFETKILKILAVADKRLLRDDLKQVISIRDKDLIKEGLQNILLFYIKRYLEDNEIAKEELKDIEYLKLLFKIEEKDLISSPRAMDETHRIIEAQIIKMYEDQIVEKDESNHKVNLQQIFSLGYDDFLKIVNKVDTKTIKLGANPQDLDTFIKNAVLKPNHKIKDSSRK